MARYRFVCIGKSPVRWCSARVERHGNLSFGDQGTLIGFKANFFPGGLIVTAMAAATAAAMLPLGWKVAAFGLLTWPLYSFIWESVIGERIQLSIKPQDSRAYYRDAGNVLGLELPHGQCWVWRRFKWFSVPRPQILSDWLVVRTRPKDRDAIVEHLKELYGDRFELKT